MTAPESHARPLYPLHGVPCVVCGFPAAGVVSTDHGTATAHYAGRDAQRVRICPHPTRDEDR